MELTARIGAGPGDSDVILSGDKEGNLRIITTRDDWQQNDVIVSPKDAEAVQQAREFAQAILRWCDGVSGSIKTDGGE